MRNCPCIFSRALSNWARRPRPFSHRIHADQFVRKELVGVTVEREQGKELVARLQDHKAILFTAPCRLAITSVSPCSGICGKHQHRLPHQNISVLSEAPEGFGEKTFLPKHVFRHAVFDQNPSGFTTISGGQIEPNRSIFSFSSSRRKEAGPHRHPAHLRFGFTK